MTDKENRRAVVDREDWAELVRVLDAVGAHVGVTGLALCEDPSVVLNHCAAVEKQRDDLLAACSGALGAFAVFPSGAIVTESAEKTRAAILAIAAAVAGAEKSRGNS